MHENKKNNVGRPQTEYNKEELEEIINLAIEELDGRIDKLTYNLTHNGTMSLTCTKIIEQIY